MEEKFRAEIAKIEGVGGGGLALTSKFIIRALFVSTVFFNFLFDDLTTLWLYPG